MIPLHSVSVSRYQTAQTCLEKYNLQYIQGLRTLAEPNRSMSVGNTAHKMIEVIWRRFLSDGYYVTYIAETHELVKLADTKSLETWWDELVFATLSKYVDRVVAELEASDAIEDNVTVENGEFLHNPSLDFETKKQHILEAAAVVEKLFVENMKHYIPIIVRKGDEFITMLEYSFQHTIGTYNIFAGIVDFVAWNTHTETVDLIDWKVRSSFSQYDDLVLDPQLRVYSYVLRNDLQVNVDRVIQFQLKSKVPKQAKTEWIRPVVLPTTSEIENQFYFNMVLNVEKRHNDAQLSTNPLVRMNFGWHCRMCQFKTICQARIMGLDVDNLIETQYTVAEWKQDQDQETENDNDNG